MGSSVSKKPHSLGAKPQAVLLAPDEDLLSTASLRARFNAVANSRGQACGGQLHDVIRTQLVLTPLAEDVERELARRLAPSMQCSFRQFKDAALFAAGVDVDASSSAVVPLAPDGALPPPPPPPAARAVVADPRRGLVDLSDGTSFVRVADGLAIGKVVVWLVMRHLTPPDLLVAARVCRLFALVARDDALWEHWLQTSLVRSATRTLRAYNATMFQLAPTGELRKAYIRLVRQVVHLDTLGQVISCFECFKQVQIRDMEVWREHAFGLCLVPEWPQVVAVCGRCRMVDRMCRTCTATLAPVSFDAPQQRFVRICESCKHKAGL